MDLTLCVSTYLSDSVLAMIAGRSPDLPTRATFVSGRNETVLAKSKGIWPNLPGGLQNNQRAAPGSTMNPCSPCGPLKHYGLCY